MKNKYTKCIYQYINIKLSNNNKQSLMLEMEDSSEFVCCEEELHDPTLTHSPNSESLGGYVKNKLTNMVYNLRHSNYIPIPGVLRQRVTLTEPHDSAYLLGKQYSYQTQEMFNAHFQNTIWFSYRKNIPGIGDDRGWGCMIRSTMMMVAEALKRATNNTSYEVLHKFTERGQFSFISICRAGEIDKRWTTSSEVVAIYQSISKSSQTSELNVINIPFSCLITSNIKEQIEKRPQRSTLIVLHTKLGMEKADKLFLPHLKELMKLPYFCGLLGGIPGKALYILGFKNDKMICLDPHYVQDQNQPFQSFFKHHPRGLDFGELSSCISVSFLVRNLQEYNSLIKQLFRIEKQQTENRVVSLMLPKQLKSELQEQFKKESQKVRKLSTDDFELIQ